MSVGTGGESLVWLDVLADSLVERFALRWRMTSRDIAEAETNRADGGAPIADLRTRLRHRVDAADAHTGDLVAHMWVWTLACSRRANDAADADLNYHALCTAHTPRLRRKLQVIHRVDPGLADELAFDALVKTWTTYWTDAAPREWKPRASLHAFLESVAYRDLVSRSRKALRERAALERLPLPKPVRSQRGLELNEAVAAVVACARRSLSGRKAEIFDLRVLRQMSGLAVADELRVSPSFVSRECKAACDKVKAACRGALGGSVAWIEDLIEVHDEPDAFPDA